jgi:tetratricopeptide (TPR) repeat protein
VELACNSDDAYRRLASAYLRLGKMNEAIGAYKKAIQVGPHYWANYNELGKAYLEGGDYERALLLYSASLSSHPPSALGMRM